MRSVDFTMIWQVTGKQTIDIPDNVNIDNPDDIRAYIESVWGNIPIPTDGEYVDSSDEIDELSDFYISGEVDEPQCYINRSEGLPAAINRNVKVEWIDLGEGIQGDYDESNPEDVHLLRFDVSVLKDGSWQAVDDASYCTNMPADTDEKILKKAVAYLAKEYANVLGDDLYASVKKLGESLSWISPDWFSDGK